MDYEKAYKDALERAKECLNDGTISNNSIAYIENIFPELRESEDERIRKEIIYHIQNCDDTIDKETEERMIAYLEKQGKQDTFCQENCKGYQETGRCFADGECEAKKNAESYWSEDDERIFSEIILRCKKYGHQEQIDWLKSLEDKYIWKPNKEQMEALKCAIEDVAKFSKRCGPQVELENEPYYSALHSLYEQLRKLKGE